MTLRIWQKLFLGTMMVVSLALIAMALLMGKSFEQGFAQYLKTFEALEIVELKDQLESTYESQGDWSFLRLPPREQQQRFGFSLVPSPGPRAAPGKNRRAGRPPPPGSRNNRRPPPRPGQEPRSGPRTELDLDSGPGPGRGSNNRPGQESLLNIAQRVAVLDVNDRHVAGPREPLDEGEQHVLSLNGQVIGSLRVMPVPSLQRNEDLEFARRQSRNAIVIGLIAMALAALMSLLMSRAVTAPLPRLAHGARKLARGDFDERVHIETGDELQQLGEDFNQLAGALEQQRTQQRSWIAQISHELRTPLAIITGEIHALQDGVRELNAQALESLDQETQRLTHLVEDLFLLSVSQAGGNLINSEVISLANVVNEFCAEADHIELVMDKDEPALVLGDPFRLHQILNNLLQNSQRYSDQPGRILVTLEHTESHWELSWEDSPPGVPKEHLEHLFDPLFRVEASRARSTGGAGLGLAIVQSITLAHGGTAHAQSSKLGGLKIVICLPRHPSQ